MEMAMEIGIELTVQISIENDYFNRKTNDTSGTNLQSDSSKLRKDEIVNKTMIGIEGRWKKQANALVCISNRWYYVIYMTL